LAGLLLVPVLLAQAAADFDLPSLLARVARPSRAAIRFVEVRYSHLLKAPLAVAGTLERGQDGTLVRRVESPYRETSIVRGRDVVILRDGSRTRQIPLDRAPELQGLISSIDAMLRGDVAQLDRSFNSTLEGSPDRWRVRLVPHDERLRRRLSDVSVYGSGDIARCFALNQPTGDASIIALDASTEADVPHARREDLEQWCGGQP
jgi:hypothetical protein